MNNQNNNNNYFYNPLVNDIEQNKKYFETQEPSFKIIDTLDSLKDAFKKYIEIPDKDKPLADFLISLEIQKFIEKFIEKKR